MTIFIDIFVYTVSTTASTMSTYIWHKIVCSRSNLCIETVLNGGQSFRWKKNDKGEWLGVLSGFVWRLKQNDDQLLYQVYGQDKKPQDGTDNHMIKEDLSINESNNKLSGKPSRKKPTKRKPKDEQDICEVPEEKIIKIEYPKPEMYTLPESAYDLSNSLVSRNTDTNSSTHNSILYDYFQLGTDLDNLYAEWSSKDEHFKNVAGNFRGIRILRQDPVENLISFVCSSNNHISRISSMVEKLCINYGEFIVNVDDHDYFSFPQLSALTGDNVESKLRELGFGYRAKFIAHIAKHLCSEKEGDWLNTLRVKSYEEAKKELMTLMGVGAKVADCVCLMSLDKPGAVPVDTHVWQITVKHYMLSLQKAKSLTDRIYNEIGQFYRDLWGPYAGWAHSVLFIADLRHNQDKGQTQTDAKKNIATTEKKSKQKATKKSKK